MPIRESIERSSKPRSGIAHGGIGTGAIELRKDGIFRNWTIFNNEPLFGGSPPDFLEAEALFFIVRYQEEGCRPQMKLLQIDEGDRIGGALLQFYTFPWMSSVERIDYEASFPQTTLRFSDPAMPFALDMQVLSPFIPGDAHHSALPGVYMRFTVVSQTARKLDVLITASMKHVVGYDRPERSYAGQAERDATRCLVTHAVGDIPTDHESWGQMTLAACGEATSYQAGWGHQHVFHEKLLHATCLPDTEDIAGQNATHADWDHPVATHLSNSSVAQSLVFDRVGDQATADFVFAWYFPNCYADQTAKDKNLGAARPKRLEGHYYANHFDSAQAVADYLIAQRHELIARSLAFHDAFYDSSLPEVVRDQINVHLNTFVASSWYTQAGDFGIQEGWTREKSWGPLATIDVGMYGAVAQAYLFPELDRAMLAAHRRLQFDSGDIQHGVGRNFSAGDAHENVKSRVDLAPQYVLMLARHCFLADDAEYLAEAWPSVRRAMDYTLENRDQDGDGLPEMEGCMSTYDNFPMWGPAALIASQFIAALQHALVCAERVGDQAAVDRYRPALERARASFVETLWNGEYFDLSNDVHGEHGRDAGCLADQVIGQWANDQSGLEPICEQAKIDRALASVWERCWEPAWGLYNCRWPGDDWLHPVADDCWFDQANTNWSGVELAFASFLLYQGHTDQALTLIETVDRRYRQAGRAWDHVEWGGHYYRAMSSWAIVNAALGFSLRNGCARFAPRLLPGDGKLFVAAAGAYGHFARAGAACSLTLVSGSWRLRELRVVGASGGVTLAGQPIACSSDTQEGELVLRFASDLVLDAGQELRIG